MRHVIIHISVLLMSFNGFTQSLNIQPTYRDLNLNNSFLGIWLYNQTDQSFKLVITRKDRQKIDKETLIDVFQAQYDYIKKGQIIAQNIGTENFLITWGFQNTQKSNLFVGTIQENQAYGSFIVELISNNEIKVKIKQMVRSSEDAKQKFSIPTEMILIRTK